MSISKTLADRIKEEAELHQRRLERLQSQELQKMIQEYEHWSKRLPELKLEIEAILGSTIEEKPAPEKKREIPNRPKTSANDVLTRMVDLLKKHPNGLSKSEIAVCLNIGKPKIEEAFALGKAQFEPRTRGPKAVIKFKV